MREWGRHKALGSPEKSAATGCSLVSVVLNVAVGGRRETRSKWTVKRGYEQVKNVIFSERELTFMFAICCRPSVCRLSVCYVRVPYSGSLNFRQYFYGIWYLGHPLTFTENFT